MTSDAGRMERLLTSKDEGYWLARGRRRALDLFHAASLRVPAYRAFLRRSGIRHDRIRTAADLAQVPPTDKKNYVDTYPLADRCWDGRLDRNSLVAVSSGTSGAPSFWPRGQAAEKEATLIHELAYRSLFAIHRRRTLIVIGFPMGMYVSGVATLLPSWLAAQQSAPATIVSVGNNRDQALRAIRGLSEHYEQVLLIGHPFFVKDVVQTGTREGINWKAAGLRMLFCSEGFSEGWRSFLLRQAGLPANGNGVYNTYGSSETLLVGHETAFSVALRRQASRGGATRRLLGGSVLPNVFQYNPVLRYLEATPEGELLFTCDNGVPLIRYNLHDSGRLIDYEDASAALKDAGGREPKDSWRLPLVALDGRSDHTVIFNAANIYPEHVHAALNHPPFLPHLTGKFVMEKVYDRRQDAALDIHVELRPEARASKTFTADVQKKIVAALRSINAEFADMERAVRRNTGRPPTLRVVLQPYQHPMHFPAGLKPRYIAPQLTDKKGKNQ